MKERNPFPDRTGTISVVNQQETIEKLGQRMLQKEPYKMAGCISKLLGSPAYASDTARFIVLAQIAEQMQDKRSGLIILGGLGYHFEEAVRLALLDAEFPIDLANIVLWQRMSHLMYEKAKKIFGDAGGSDAECLAKNIKKRAAHCEFFAFQNLAAAIIKIASSLGEGLCESELRDLIQAGHFCDCPICSNIAIGTKRTLDGWEDKIKPNGS